MSHLGQYTVAPLLCSLCTKDASSLLLFTSRRESRTRLRAPLETIHSEMTRPCAPRPPARRNVSSGLKLQSDFGLTIALLCMCYEPNRISLCVQATRPPKPLN